MRDEADGEAEELLDLGRVLVRADAVRRDVLEHGRSVRARLQRAARAGDARLRVDDDAVGIDRAGERAEREQRGGRITAGVGDQPARRGRQLGQRIAPALIAAGVGEAVPGGVSRRVGEPVRARRGRRRPRRRAARAKRPPRGRGSRRSARRRRRAPRRSGRRRAGRRGRCGRAADRARSPARPASESDPSATSSSSGCARTRSSVSCPAKPAAPMIAVETICVLCRNSASMQLQGASSGRGRG